MSVPDLATVLDDFHRHCLEDLDDVEVIGVRPLVLKWRREVVHVELREAIDEVPELPLLALAPLDDALIDRLLDDERLRARLAVYDLLRGEKASAVRSAVFTYFEWFLQEAYGMKVVASGSFTAGLVARGLISLGMG
jgi:hypothetical protein